MDALHIFSIVLSTLAFSWAASPYVLHQWRLLRAPYALPTAETTAAAAPRSYAVSDRFRTPFFAIAALAITLPIAMGWAFNVRMHHAHPVPFVLVPAPMPVYDGLPNAYAISAGGYCWASCFSNDGSRFVLTSDPTVYTNLNYDVGPNGDVRITPP